MTSARIRTFLLIAAVTLGGIAPFAGERGEGRGPEGRRKGDGPASPAGQLPLDVRALALQIEREDDHVTARELGGWIRSRRAGLRIVDLRTAAEVEANRMPGAKRMTIEAAVSTRWSPDDSIVLVSAGGAHAAQAWVLLRAAGHGKVWFLRGGHAEWANYLATDAEARAYFGSATPRDEEMPGC